MSETGQATVTGKITLQTLAASIQRSMAEQGIDLEDLLADLREGCHDYDTE